MGILRQYTCLIISPITVCSFDFLGWSGLILNDAADPKQPLDGWCLMFVYDWVLIGATNIFL